MNTKKIQIAVSIDETGYFNCCPINRAIDKRQAFSFADEVMDGEQLRHVLIEVEVPLPETVEGKVLSVQDM